MRSPLLMSFRLGLAGVLFASISACSGGGSGSPSAPPPVPPPAPAGLSYPSIPTLTRGVAMTAASPTVSGTVSSYVISPALPAGLAIHTTTGVISGTPSAAAPAAQYQVTASNAGGSTTASVSITIIDTVPVVSYPQSQYTLSTGAPTSITPSSSGGGVVTWAIDPALPAGLAFNSGSGVISGTPSADSPETTYLVTATNSGGTDTFDLTLAVQSAELFDLGHADLVVEVEQTPQRILSVDFSQHATLWNAQTGAILASRDTIRWSQTLQCSDPCDGLIQLEGDTAAMQSDDSLLLLDAMTGVALATVVVPNGPIRWWRLSSDGNYIAASTDSELRVWSRTGATLFIRPGNYGVGKAFAAAGQLRIGGGPAGANVIERLAVPAGTSTTSATHQGSFHSWFLDGDKFLSNVGTTVWVYSADVAQLDLLALDTIEGLQGRGEWFWTFPWVPHVANIYRVGASATPAGSFAFTSMTRLIAGTDVLGALEPSNAKMFLVDLSGATPVRTELHPPADELRSFSAVSPTDWAVGAGKGVLLGEMPGAQIYSYGRVVSIAADEKTIAAATASGPILQFHTETRDLVRQIPLRSIKLELSADGTQLFARSGPALATLPFVDTLRVFSVETGNMIREWLNGAPDYAFTRAFDLADGADFLARTVSKYGTGDGVSFSNGRFVTTLSNEPVWSDTNIPGGTPLFLSPDGMVTAIDIEVGVLAPPTPPGVNLYTNGTLSGAVPGSMVGWLDNTHLVVNRYVPGVMAGSFVFNHVDVISTTGVVQASLQIPMMYTIQPVGPNAFYSQAQNVIFDAASGATLWSSPVPTRGVGAVAGPNVVFTTGSKLRIESR